MEIRQAFTKVTYPEQLEFSLQNIWQNCHVQAKLQYWIKFVSIEEIFGQKFIRLVKLQFLAELPLHNCQSDRKYLWINIWCRFLEIILRYILTLNMVIFTPKFWNWDLLITSTWIPLPREWQKGDAGTSMRPIMYSSISRKQKLFPMWLLCIN